jgi:hypothetical protein
MNMNLNTFGRMLEELTILAYHAKVQVEISSDDNIIHSTTETGERFQSTHYEGTLQDNIMETIEWIMDNHYRATYYHKECSNLKMLDHLQIQIKGENSQTKWMSLNDESIPAVRFFLKKYRQFVTDHCSGEYGLGKDDETQ